MIINEYKLRNYNNVKDISKEYFYQVIKLSTITIHSWFFKENPNYISHMNKTINQ